LAKESVYIGNEPQLQQLIQRCLGYQPDAQKALFKLYYGYAKSICLRYSASKEESDEILNSGFLKVFQNLDKYNTLQPFRAWLRSIMINTAIDYYRKEQKYAHSQPLTESMDFQIHENVIDDISADEIMDLVQKLPTSYRTVFVLYVVDGYNHREIGELLGITDGTSKSNLAVARTKLKAMLIAKNPEYESFSRSQE
jgi:RNA polymerase sigma-70 factor (ECF subfamily)